MDQQVYSLDIFGKTKLCCEDDTYQVYLFDKNCQVLLVIIKSSNVMILMKTSASSNQFLPINGNEIKTKQIKQLLDDGSRWEGDLYNEMPFGYGDYYDGEGN